MSFSSSPRRWPARARRPCPWRSTTARPSAPTGPGRWSRSGGRSASASAPPATPPAATTGVGTRAATPGRDPLPQRRGLAGLRAGARRERPRRAVRPRPEGGPTVGAALCDRRRASPSARRVRADPNRRPARLRDAGPGPCRPARAGADGRVSATRCLTTVDQDEVHSSRLRVDQALWIGSIQRTASGSRRARCRG